MRFIRVTRLDAIMDFGESENQLLDDDRFLDSLSNIILRNLPGLPMGRVIVRTVKNGMWDIDFSLLLGIQAYGLWMGELPPNTAGQVV